MKRTALLGTRVTPVELEHFATVAKLNGRSVSAELRRVAAEHVMTTAAAMNNQAPGVDGPERSELYQETAHARER